MILDDANHPAVEGGLYVIAYGEMVDGYRHAYEATTPRLMRKFVRYSRSANHPADPRCPECYATVHRAAMSAQPEGDPDERDD